MNFNLLLLPTLLLTATLGWAGVNSAKVVSSKSGRIGLNALAAVLALPALLFAVYYLHVLDNAAWFYAFRAAPYTEMTAAGIGLGVGLFLAQMKLFRPLVILSAVVILMIPYVKPILAPLRIPMKTSWKSGKILQSTPSTCGPCSAAAILLQYGIPATESELARECFTYRGGTENWYVARALQRRGLGTHYIVTSPQTETLPYPSIAGVKLGGGGGHFISVLGRSGSRYVINDPLVGKSVQSLQQLRSKYGFTGFFLQVDPPHHIIEN